MMRSKVLGGRGQSTRMSQPEAWNGWNGPIHKVGIWMKMDCNSIKVVSRQYQDSIKTVPRPR